jgi:alkyldihydroxyacetonephosphate synthase
MSIGRPHATRSDISFWGWGDPARTEPLPEDLRRLLRTLGIGSGPSAARSLDDLRLPAARLASEIRSELEAIVGAQQGHADDESRARHAGGKSTIDLLELRRSGPPSVPDLVLTPGSHDEVLAVLACCSAHDVAVVPFGGGTSVVGGLSPDASRFAGTVALDVRRLNALVELDPESRLAVLEPGLRGPEAEELLARHGYTLGHFPQSFEYATLGGFAATRSSGQSSAGYGRFDDRVMALRVATPGGTLSLGRAPKSAAGPDLRQLVLGSEGAFGVITSLTLAVSPAPERRVYEGWRLPGFREGTAVLRALAQDGPQATVLRLSDEAETALGPPRPGELEPARTGRPAGCLAIVGWEGAGADVSARQTAAANLLARAGGVPVAGGGENWAAGRFRAPYLRDSLLDAGALVETLETVSFWSKLPGLYEAVSHALRLCLTDLGTPPLILSHISHVYPAGASLYFTVACAQLPDPVAQWRAAKAAAGEAILAAGGSITHHHGVGVDHRDLYLREIGPLAAGIMEAVKRTIDPAGILNPGILLPVSGHTNC